MRKCRLGWLSGAISIVFMMAFFSGLLAETEGKPLILQDMTWTDVRDYLKTNDMVIVPLGSTEQHGPHMPLGTDWYSALEIAKMISARTGVLVAPVLQVGYSPYHSAFPGTLSLKPETLEQVLYESAEMLVKYGFKRLMFFNSHGGNIVSETVIIHRINHNLEAMAVAIGEGSQIQKDNIEIPGVSFDEHAGVGETSIGLFLWPELVHMDRAEKPQIHFSKKVEELLALLKQNPQLAPVFGSLLAVPQETKKGGSSGDISSNGIWSSGDPTTARREMGEKIVKKLVENAVSFIQAWKQAKS